MLSRRVVLAIAFACALAPGLLLSLGAQARTEARCRYSKSQTYSGALRYLRVDLGYEILEKDPDAAYLIFRYVAPGRARATNGSIEIVEARDETKLLVQLAQMPQYHETVLRDGLMRKLRDEYGDPPPRDPPPEPDPEPPADDAGTE